MQASRFKDKHGYLVEGAISHTHTHTHDTLMTGWVYWLLYIHEDQIKERQLSTNLLSIFSYKCGTRPAESSYFDKQMETCQCCETTQKAIMWKSFCSCYCQKKHKTWMQSGWLVTALRPCKSDHATHLWLMSQTTKPVCMAKSEKKIG